MSQPANSAADALNAALDALTQLHSAIGLISDLLSKIQRQNEQCEFHFDSSGQFIGMSYRCSVNGIIPAESDHCIEIRSNCEYLPKYVQSLWEAQPTADRAIASLPSQIIQKLDALTSKPWLASVRRDCLDVILKWPGESGHQTSLGAHKVGGGINEMLEKALRYDPHATWEKYGQLIEQYKHELYAVRDVVQSATSEKPSENRPPEAIGRIWSVEDYYRAKELYESNGAIFNPALDRGSPAAYHVIAQQQLKALQPAIPTETPVATISDKPEWDQRARVLKYGGVVIKQFRRVAHNQFLVLQAFQESGWPPEILDPLPRDNTDQRQRLHSTITALNQGCKANQIKFCSDGRGTGYGWGKAIAKSKRNSKRK